MKIRHDDANEVRSICRQRPRELIRTVIHLLSDGEDPRSRFELISGWLLIARDTVIFETLKRTRDVFQSSRHEV